MSIRSPSEEETARALVQEPSDPEHRREARMDGDRISGSIVPRHRRNQWSATSHVHAHHDLDIRSTSDRVTPCVVRRVRASSGAAPSSANPEGVLVPTARRGFEDPMTIAPAIDRIVHHAAIPKLTSESCRSGIPTVRRFWDVAGS
jgi:hypothetical protein